MQPSPSVHRMIVVVLAGLCLAWPTAGSAAAKGEQLRQTMADIALLSSQLAQRKADAVGIRNTLAANLEKIRDEARRTMREKSVSSEAEASKIPRLWYDLMLIAEIDAYMKRYTQRIDHYRVAIDRLSYLYQQADDDLKIVNTLADMKIDALISQAQKIIETHLPDAQTLVIQSAGSTFDPPETIWRTIASER